MRVGLLSGVLSVTAMYNSFLMPHWLGPDRFQIPVRLAAPLFPRNSLLIGQAEPLNNAQCGTWALHGIPQFLVLCVQCSSPKFSGRMPNIA